MNEKQPEECKHDKDEFCKWCCNNPVNGYPCASCESDEYHQERVVKVEAEIEAEDQQTEGWKELREELADIEHERWADWQKYCHSRGIEDKNGEGYLCIPSGLVKHWERQIATSYKDLTEEEKDSDREQVDRYWKKVEAFITKTLAEERKKAVKEATLAERNKHQTNFDKLADKMVEQSHDLEYGDGSVKKLEIEKAVVEERERCAKEADEFAKIHNKTWGKKGEEGTEMARVIAQALRTIN